MIKQKEEHGPEMTKLLDRLYGGTKKIKHFSITPGPNWNNLSMEDKASIINKMLDSVANGEAQLIDNID